MKDKNYTEIFEKISDENKKEYDLIIDRLYKSNQNSNVSADVISKLFGVGNGGGFRYKGDHNSPLIIVFYTSGEDTFWRDELDEEFGTFVYYGDNKKPGKDLRDTKLRGNEILESIFAYAASDDLNERKKIPPIFIMKKAGVNRDVKFLGLAVPGVNIISEKEWLTAIWATNKQKGRFQNYKAYFTVLDTSSGSEFKRDTSAINLAWVNDILAGRAYNSEFAPFVWKKYIEKRGYFRPLQCEKQKLAPSKEEQLPQSDVQFDIVKKLHDICIKKDGGYAFEKVSAYLVQKMNPDIVDIETTRNVRDGGFDAYGKYRIFNDVQNTINVDFYLEAKCYSYNEQVGVKETSRLISRIKNRQFGILFTTSTIHSQAYKEVIEDGHPIVFIVAKDIGKFLFENENIKSTEDLEEWYERLFCD